MSSSFKKKKLVAVGDGCSGKTRLLTVFAKNEFSSEWAITFCEEYQGAVQVDGETVHFSLCDTGGDDSCDRLRPIQYPGTDVILICFSVMNPYSFKNVRDKWYPEVKHYLPNVPIILVGLQSDLKKNAEALQKLSGQTPISVKQAKKLSVQIGAIEYIETSAWCRINVDKVFVVAAKSEVESKVQKKTVWYCDI